MCRSDSEVRRGTHTIRRCYTIVLQTLQPRSLLLLVDPLVSPDDRLVVWEQTLRIPLLTYLQELGQRCIGHDLGLEQCQQWQTNRFGGSYVRIIAIWVVVSDIHSAC